MPRKINGVPLEKKYEHRKPAETHLPPVLFYDVKVLNALLRSKTTPDMWKLPSSRGNKVQWQQYSNESGNSVTEAAETLHQASSTSREREANLE